MNSGLTYPKDKRASAAHWSEGSSLLCSVLMNFIVRYTLHSQLFSQLRFRLLCYPPSQSCRLELRLDPAHPESLSQIFPSISPIIFPRGHTSPCYILWILSKFNPFLQVHYDLASLPDCKLICKQGLHLNKNLWTVHPLNLTPRTPGTSLVIL